MVENTTKLSDELKQQITGALRPVFPDKVILFGSYAWGNPTEDSDIDLYVVTHDNFVPSTWKQRRDMVRSISSRILDLRIRYPIDLIVHTRPMHNEFVARESSFAREVMTRGTQLL